MTLVERLGYSPEQKLLIVNCDDLGASHSANVGCEAALRRGFATSTTLMVPCPWAREAVERCKDLDIGIHLTLTCEYPTYRWRALTGARSLHDGQGYMPLTAQEAWANADLRDVEAECRAQIEQAYAWDVDITHLDSHMGTVQINPAFFDVYAALAQEFRLPLRMVGPDLDLLMGAGLRKKAEAANLMYTDEFVHNWGKPSRAMLLEHLPSLKPGVTEVYLHPVEDGPELRAYDKTEADSRVHDHALLMDAEMRDMIAEHGIRPISYRPLRELLRNS